MIPVSMKTGFTNDPDGVNVSGDLKDMQERITSIMMVLMKRSLVTAATYVLHCGGGEVEASHISKGIKLEATTFFDSDDLEEETADMQARIFGDDNNEDEDEDEDEVDEDWSDTDTITSSDGEDEYVDEELDDEKKKMLDTFIDIVEDDLGTDGPTLDTRTEGNICECDICKKMDNIDAIWEAWNVDDDPVKCFLKKHVNNTDLLVKQELGGM
jgi:hypothetical protein